MAFSSISSKNPFFSAPSGVRVNQIIFPTDNKNNENQQNQNNQAQPKITPQAAEQMLQAVQEKENQTQDKVNKEKAKALKSKQREKNW